MLTLGNLNFRVESVSNTLVVEYPAHNSLTSPSLAGKVTAGVWHHIAYTYSGGGYANGTSFRFFVDGVQYSDVAFEGNVSMVPLPTSGSIELGRQQPGTGRFFNGSMRAVRVSSGVRYADNFTAPRRLSVDATTLALWQMDAGSGSTAVDSGSGGYDATLISSVTLDAADCSTL